MAERTAVIKLPIDKAAAPDVVALTLQVLGLRWIPMDECKPPMGMDFFGLTVKGPQDYHVEHCVFDGSGREGLEEVTYWFPAPRLPRKAVDSFPPHDGALGPKLVRSLRAWIEARGDG